MKKYLLPLLFFSFLLSANTATAQKNSTIKGEEVTYTGADGVVQKGYVAYDGSLKKERPAIIIIHEWWGSNAYVRMRADMLAKLGYIAIALDMYGDGKQGPTPPEATALATPFYKDPQLAKSRIEAAIAKIKTYPETNPGKIAAIGYCFGGSMVLNAAKMGMDLKGVVSFHGGLAGVPAVAGVTKAKILVCHGEADKFISPEELKNFRTNLDAEKVSYTFISYPDATHAFTNKESTANGVKFSIPIAYNAAADKKSWEDMKLFFKKIF
jgi:dienelactone hydrolase